MSSIPFADASFDLVCAFDIVEHVDNDQAALAEPMRSAAREAIARVAARTELSDDTREIVTRSLAD